MSAAQATQLANGRDHDEPKMPPTPTPKVKEHIQNMVAQAGKITLPQWALFVIMTVIAFGGGLYVSNARANDKIEVLSNTFKDAFKVQNDTIAMQGAELKANTEDIIRLQEANRLSAQLQATNEKLDRLINLMEKGR